MCAHKQTPRAQLLVAQTNTFFQDRGTRGGLVATSWSYDVNKRFGSAAEEQGPSCKGDVLFDKLRASRFLLEPVLFKVAGNYLVERGEEFSLG